MLPAVGQALRSELQACYDREMVTPPLGVIRNSAGHRAASKAKAITYMISCIGSRCRMTTIGGAKVSPALLQLIQEYLPIKVYHSYGTSESAGITVDGKIVRNVQVKLLDRPDLGYTSSDKPYPRGEICVKTQAQVSVNHWLCSDTEKAAVLERYLEDGYFRTVSEDLSECLFILTFLLFVG